MIVFIYGTSGELIKLAPVIKQFESHGFEYLAISTEQQPTQTHALCEEFGIRQPDVLLAKGFRGDDLSNTWHIFQWVAAVVGNFLLYRRQLTRALRAKPGRHVVMVHGDTFTTVLGCLMGRALRLPVAHLEAGLRSGDWRHPFPEELNRRLVTRLTALHYAPNAEARKNLTSAPGRVVNLGANTVQDSLALVPLDAGLTEAERDGRLRPGQFGVVSIHRFELLTQPSKFEEILKVLAAKAADVPLAFIDHPVTASKVDQYGLGSLFDNERFIRIPRLGYINFVSLLRRSAFLVTDSGGAQEECYFLNHPCLVHRAAVERHEGLGANALLSEMDIGRVHDFLADPSRFRADSPPRPASPTETVITDLVRMGVWDSRTLEHA